MRQMTLGSYIRSLRTQNEMTQAQLASRLGVTDKAVSKWERDLSYPDMALFPRLADLLGVSASDLLRECLDEGQPSRLLQIFGMTHDIRTPLHIIIGCANLAELHRKEPELLLRYLESIRISGEYLIRAIDHLMQVAGQETEDGMAQTPLAGTAEGKDYPANIRELGEYLNHRAEARKNALQEYDFSGKRILVADDIHINREIAEEILKQVGAAADFAPDGSRCVEMVEQAPAGRYDLVLMDIMMPVMDGLEATRRIRQLADPQKAGIPIVAVSANVQEKERKQALEAGMNAFVEKPIFIDRLLAVMADMLQPRR